MRTLIALSVLSICLPSRARADAAASFAVVKGESVITYHLVHKLHRFDGVSKSVEGKARVAADGTAQVMVRVPVESFDSSNVNRDAHMKETVEAARYANVELKAVGKPSLPAAPSYPLKVPVTFKAQINFHGVAQNFELPVELTYESATRVRATAHFTVSLESFKIDRPSLMFVKIDDGLTVDADVVFLGAA